MSEYSNRVRALVVDECDRQMRAYEAKKADDLDRLGFVSSFRGSFRLWRINGSAGRAVTWLEEISAEHPDAPPHQVVEQLELRIEDEIAAHPRIYTTAHLRGVLDIARRALATQVIDGPLAGQVIHVDPGARNGQVAARRLAHVTGQRIAVKLEPPQDQVELMIDIAAVHALEARPIKRPWWRRAGSELASAWLDTWHAIPYITPEATLVILIAAAAFAIILAILIPPGAK